MSKSTARNGVSPKIPMLLGLLLLLLGVVGGVYLVQNRQAPVETQAEVGTAPIGVEISNITNNSATVSWITQNSASGFVTYGKEADKLNSVARDKRDLLSSDYQSYTSHFVQLVGLEANSEYYLLINSGRVAYKNSDNELYKIKTLANGVESELEVISGKLQTTDGGGQEGALVYVSGPNLSKQSTLTDSNGEWSILLKNASDPSGTKGATIEGNDEISIRTSSNRGNSSALILGSGINQLPTMTSGETFDFRSLTDSETKSASKFNFIDDLGAQSSPDRQTINIWNPQENEAISTTRPLFIGTAPANKEIGIIIVQRQTEIKGNTSSDERGNWRFTPTEELALGSYVVRASYTNDSGITFQAERRFSVLGSTANIPAIESSPGGQIAQVSPSPTRIPTVTLRTSPSPTVTVRPSASPTPTTRVSLTPSPSIGVSLTPSPSVRVSLTPSPSLSPTASPAARATATLSPSPTSSPTKTPTPTKVVSEVSPTVTPTPTVASELPLAATTLPTYIAGAAVLILALGAAILLL